MALALRKRGKFWYARGPVPMRQADGRIARVRIEESTREVSKARASRVAADIYQHYYEQAYRPQAKASPSFTDAALTYVETKQPSERDRAFMAKLVSYFGELPLSEIDQGVVAAAAASLYPGCKASTINRAVYAPVVTAMRLAGFNPQFARPRISRTPPEIPSEEWFGKILPHCPPNLAALIVFLTVTGRRVTEATRLTWDDVDADTRTARIRRTKAGSAAVVPIPDGVLRRLSGSGSQRLFGYASRFTVNQAIERICKRHGLPYYSSHKLGRHSFASRLLKRGKSTKFVAEAGGWASTRMVDLIYGHLEQSDVARETAEMGQNWCKERKIVENPEEKG